METSWTRGRADTQVRQRHPAQEPHWIATRRLYTQQQQLSIQNRCLSWPNTAANLQQNPSRCTVIECLRSNHSCNMLGQQGPAQTRS
jgi:hypothetical protein